MGRFASPQIVCRCSSEPEKLTSYVMRYSDRAASLSMIPVSYSFYWKKYERFFHGSIGRTVTPPFPSGYIIIDKSDRFQIIHTILDGRTGGRLRELAVRLHRRLRCEILKIVTHAAIRLLVDDGRRRRRPIGRRAATRSKEHDVHECQQQEGPRRSGSSEDQFSIFVRSRPPIPSRYARTPRERIQSRQAGPPGDGLAAARKSEYCEKGQWVIRQRRHSPRRRALEYVRSQSKANPSREAHRPKTSACSSKSPA